MAYGITPKPGSNYLCEGKCAHVDCAATRLIIESKCPICKKKIGTEAKWMNDDAGPMHAACAWKLHEPV